MRPGTMFVLSLVLFLFFGTPNFMVTLLGTSAICQRSDCRSSSTRRHGSVPHRPGASVTHLLRRDDLRTAIHDRVAAGDGLHLLDDEFALCNRARQSDRH